jgi:serine/threonine protein kinase
VQALEYLHKRNVIHRDLKLENILISKTFIKDQEYLHVKICDFGWCAHTVTGTRSTFCGTPDYLAPEQVNETPYDNKVDLWAVGVLTHELLLGKTPFTGAKAA